ncbi:magnesium-translocating P-type ATPase [Telmatocola sphagniphila]|uniref:Magnesium-transporting ATPase, P-type 1 n=1 Tax=Telmatocola sphagniphila TaxID=1123043 RepID=A0A8E6EWN7_9BACT|nr:magnesium-translocating P-type ATPase [Telmatocola sphagniphila]QVL34165.1 magnesium-translocating P-type ATPase [Telmatocola sphagniphila]
MAGVKERPVSFKNLFSAIKREKPTIKVSQIVVDSASLNKAALFDRLKTQENGLSSQEVEARLQEHGHNILAKDQRGGFGKLLWHAVLNPLVILLAILATISFATDDMRAGIVMTLMIVLGVGLKLFQEAKADSAAAKLKAMISVTATALRDGAPKEVAVSDLVPGDIVKLAAGDMIPGDVRIIEAKDLFVIQGSLTGESFPVEKFEVEKNPATTAPIELTSIAFLGTSVESGSATGVVVATGGDTFLGGMAETLSEQVTQTSFDRGVARFTWLMLRFILVMVPLVFLINGLTKHNWSEAFFFALAVAVGLTPEMLPMIVTVCLSKGAIAMSRKKVIVKRINAIQNLGAMDVLCTDKTGTLTMDHVILEKHCDVVLKEDEGVLALAYMNSHFQTGLKSVLDRAILAHTDTQSDAHIPDFQKVDEIPFDFQRRIMSVVVRTPENKDRIISKGAPEEIFARCKQFELDGQLYPMEHMFIQELKEEYEQLSSDGFRVLAIASKDLTPREAGSQHSTPYSKQDETDLILNGYVAFLDPPKDTAKTALKALEGHGISVKVVTGDNELVSRKVCKEVGLATDFVLLGTDVDKLSDSELAETAEKTTLFARVSPAHKQRIITALRSRNHTVGFMGDGINDAPALRAADVGISVDTAVDIAKESADMILLEKSLMVLEEGVIEGRKVFANILKYIRMGASSNFGNMFSVLGTSIFLPYLPMAPIQILANNLLYDISQTAIPTDEVDPEQVERPRPWDIRQLTRYILFIGPCSSIFDYATFFIMLYLFGCWNIATPEEAAYSESLFQTGWFVESLLTQTLIIHVIRTNRIPFLQSLASWPLIVMSAIIMCLGVAMPYTLLGDYLGFKPLPGLYWPLLVVILLTYVMLTQFVKMWLLKRKWI